MKLHCCPLFRFRFWGMFRGAVEILSRVLIPDKGFQWATVGRKTPTQKTPISLLTVAGASRFSIRERRTENWELNGERENCPAHIYRVTIYMKLRVCRTKVTRSFFGGH